jgi:hypothetical protein
MEHAAEAFTKTDRPVRAAVLAAGLDDFVVEPLVVSLAVIMVEVFVDHAPQMGFTKENHAIRRFAFERPVKSLDVSITVLARSAGCERAESPPAQSGA